MTQADDPILEKILKLLALAADSAATPDEAETAAAMASKLMFKHQIDQARVVAKQRATRPSMNSDLYGREIIGITKSAAWERDLLAWLAYHYDCNLYTHQKWSFEVIGHKDNVSLISLLFKWLVAELGRLASRAYKTNRPTNDLAFARLEHMDPFRFHVSFKRGATVSIMDRLRRQKREQTEEVRAEEGGAALMLIGEQIKDGALAHFKPYMQKWYEQKWSLESPEARAKREAEEAEWKVRYAKIQEEEAKHPKRRIARGRMPRVYQPITSAKAYSAGRIAGDTVRLTGSHQLKGGD